MPDLDALLDDLRAEHDSLDVYVGALDDEAWAMPTPAEGWNIRDQVAHLAFFDDQATLALTDPEEFGSRLSEVASDLGAFMDRSVTRGRELGNAGTLAWWREAREEMVAAAEKVEPGERIAWFGPPMSPASFISARLMETWAHGQDVVDALGVKRPAEARLRHVAHLCVLSRKHSYALHGLPTLSDDIWVTLRGPDGHTWAWGSEDAEDRIAGPAEDFCLVATQRRHPDDTALTIDGDEAKRWMSIAQAYAGPPGNGRRPGQFS